MVCSRSDFRDRLKLGIGEPNPSAGFSEVVFRKHVELLLTINQSWAHQQQADYDAVLAEHPLDDAASARLDELKRSQTE